MDGSDKALVIRTDCMITSTVGGYFIQFNQKVTRPPRPGCTCDTCTDNRDDANDDVMSPVVAGTE